MRWTFNRLSRMGAIPCRVLDADGAEVPGSIVAFNQYSGMVERIADGGDSGPVVYRGELVHEQVWHKPPLRWRKMQVAGGDE